MSGFAFTGRAAAPAAPPYASGRYYIADGLGRVTAGTAVTAATIYWTPGFIRRPVTIASLLARLTTLAAGGNVQFSLYAADPVTGYPTGAPLFTSASQSTAAAGVIEVAAALTLSPGLYWFALQCDNSTAVFSTCDNGGFGYWVNIGTVATNNMLGVGSAVMGLSKAGVFGTWPALTGNAANDGLAEQVNKPPSWAFKVA